MVRINFSKKKQSQIFQKNKENDILQHEFPMFVSSENMFQMLLSIKL